jgi:hypothetical protein
MAFGFFKGKRSNDKVSPDFSGIDSNEKAMELYNKGQLSKVFLMPLEFGGQDGPMNCLYVPEVVVELKSAFDLSLENLLIEGKNLGYSASPEYKGKSFIPSKLNITVTGDVQFKETIEIW